MSKTRVLGVEPQLAMVLLLVIGAVLFGYFILLFGSIGTFGGIVISIATHPADWPWPILLLLLCTSLFLPILAQDPDEQEGAPRPRYETDMLWITSIGIMIGLTAAHAEVETPAGLLRNLLAYAAMAGAALHFMIVWMRPGEKIVQWIILGLLSLPFPAWLFYIWLAKGEGKRALIMAMFFAGYLGVTRLAERWGGSIDYRHDYRHR